MALFSHIAHSSTRYVMNGAARCICVVLWVLVMQVVVFPSRASSASAVADATPFEASQPSVSACGLLSNDEVASILGNPVLPGEEYAGPEVCRWDTEDADEVSLLLMVRPPGSIREQVLCQTLRSGGGPGELVAGVAEIARWHFSSVGTLFDSGELVACGSSGYVSLDLNGKRDEPTLRNAALALLNLVFQRL